MNFLRLGVLLLLMYPAVGLCQQADLRNPIRHLTRSDVCPFECCTYGEWNVVEGFTAFAEKNTASTHVFAAEPRNTVRGISGDVHVIKPGVVLIKHELPEWDWEFKENPVPPVQPGDTLLVLDGLGEGLYNVFHRDTVFTVMSNWRSRENLAELEDWIVEQTGGILESYTEAVWWALVENTSGRRGWVDMGGSIRVRGIDGYG